MLGGSAHRGRSLRRRVRRCFYLRDQGNVGLSLLQSLLKQEILNQAIKLVWLLHRQGMAGIANTCQLRSANALVNHLTRLQGCPARLSLPLSRVSARLPPKAARRRAVRAPCSGDHGRSRRGDSLRQRRRNPSTNSRSSEKFMHGIKVLMAKNFCDNLSEETCKGMLEKARQGIWHPTRLSVTGMCPVQMANGPSSPTRPQFPSSRKCSSCTRQADMR